MKEVIAFDLAGRELFRAPVAGVEALAVGSDCLFGVVQPLGLVRID